MPTFLAWNIRHGGGSRSMPGIALSVLDHAPDVVLLTEFRTTTGGQIAGVLADHGWRFQHSTRPPKGCNGLLIASRSPVVIRQHTTGRAPLAPEASLRRYCEIEIPEMGLSLAGVHIPCDGKGLGREAVFSIVLEAARRRRSESFILLGDFNAGRHHLDESGATFTCTRCFGQLAALGYRDAFRHLHPGAREFSWYAHTGDGFRIDHAFISDALVPRLRDCRYSHRERTANLSDHSALVLTLGPS